jgi:hypothetical protein
MDPTFAVAVQERNHRQQMEEWFDLSLSCYALMAICFLSVLCINSGGTIGKWILWRVNEDYVDSLYTEDDVNNSYHENKYKKQQNMNKRKQQMLSYFEAVGSLQVVSDQDRVDFTNTKGSSSNFYSIRDKRVSPSTCMICLEAFQAGDTLLWSQNQDCSHAFHQECLIEYFSRFAGTGDPAAPCPCCRRDFYAKQDSGSG